MKLLTLLLDILNTRFGVVSLILSSFISLFVLFLFTERMFFSSALSTTFPLDLFIQLLPQIFYTFLFGKGVVLLLHYIFTSLLLGVYVTLILYIFVRKRYFSFTSFSTSLLGLVGITFGISCLSCGALAGFILLSMFGTGSALFLLHNNFVFLIVGEALLLLSIYVTLSTIKKLR